MGTTDHVGWDDPNYDTSQLGGFSGIDPQRGVHWDRVYKRARAQASMLRRKKEVEGLSAREDDQLDVLEARCETIQAWAVDQDLEHVRQQLADLDEDEDEAKRQYLQSLERLIEEVRYATG